eukprot:GHVN01034788.1.p1 GENE.GHVN01034788.1~~GHVN01034788.1.p1  ORF type:complete len:1904 (-),score=180.16 GHVN01034788.1:1709-7420(-)
MRRCRSHERYLFPFCELTILFLPVPVSSMLPTNCGLPVAHGAMFYNFDGLIVLDISSLHMDGEIDRHVYDNNFILAEAIVAMWFGTAIEVSPSKAAQDLWLLVALRMYLVFAYLRRTVGTVEVKARQWQMIEHFCDLVESGNDRIPLFCEGPLAAAHRYGSIEFRLKCALLFHSLRLLLNEHRWLPSDLLSRLIIEFIEENIERTRCEPSMNFFEKVLRSVKGFWIDKGYWKWRYDVRPHQDVEDPTVAAPTVDNLIVEDYSNLTQSEINGVPIDICKLCTDLNTFVETWVKGTGCPQLVIGAFISAHRRADLLLYLDQRALQPPVGLSHSGRTIYSPVMLRVAHGLLRQLVEVAKRPLEVVSATRSVEQCPAKCWTRFFPFDQKPIGTDQDCTNGSFLSKLNLSLPQSYYDCIDLFLRRKTGGTGGTGYGFGYVGKDTSPSFKGLGPLYDTIMQRLEKDWHHKKSDWGDLASDFYRDKWIDRENPAAHYIPVASNGEMPWWTRGILCAQVLSGLCTYEEYSGLASGAPATVTTLPLSDSIRVVARGVNTKALRVTTFSSGSHYVDDGLFMVPMWRWKLKAQTETNSSHSAVSHLLERRALAAQLAPMEDNMSTGISELDTPVSGGLYKFWSGVMRLQICEPKSFLENAKALSEKVTPVLLEVLDFRCGGGKVGIGGDGSSSSDARNATEYLINRYQSQHEFKGVCSEADSGCLFDLLSGAEASGRAADITKLPLWIMADPERYWIARIRRFQSMSMWENQLVNDNNVSAQIEAAFALGHVTTLATVQSAISALRASLERHNWHPVVRSTSVQSLCRLYSSHPHGSAEQAAQVLFEYIRTYHYHRKNIRHPGASFLESEVAIVKSTRGTKGGRGGGRRGIGEMNAKREKEKEREPMIVSRSPPAECLSELVFLDNFYTSISQMRDSDGRTPDFVFDLIVDPLTEVSKDLIPLDDGSPSATEFCTSSFRSHLLKCLGDCSLPFFPINNEPPLETLMTQGDRPMRPKVDDFSEGLWERICWNASRIYNLETCNPPSANQAATTGFIHLVSRQTAILDLLRQKSLDEMGGVPFDFVPFLPTPAQKLPIVFPPHPPPTATKSESPWPSIEAPLSKGSASTNGTPDTNMEARSVEAPFNENGEENQGEHRRYYQRVYNSQAIHKSAINAICYCLVVGSLVPPECMKNRSVEEICQGSPFKQLDTSCKSQSGHETKHPSLRCRWTSWNQRLSLIRTGESVFNGILFATQLESLLFSSESVPLLLSVWESLVEVLGEVSEKEPQVFVPFCLAHHIKETAKPESVKPEPDRPKFNIMGVLKGSSPTLPPPLSSATANSPLGSVTATLAPFPILCEPVTTQPVPPTAQNATGNIAIGSTTPIALDSPIQHQKKMKKEKKRKSESSDHPKKSKKHKSEKHEGEVALVVQSMPSVGQSGLAGLDRAEREPVIRAPNPPLEGALAVEQSSGQLEAPLGHPVAAEMESPHQRMESSPLANPKFEASLLSKENKNPSPIASNSVHLAALSTEAEGECCVRGNMTPIDTLADEVDFNELFGCDESSEGARNISSSAGTVGEMEGVQSHSPLTPKGSQSTVGAIPSCGSTKTSQGGVQPHSIPDEEIGCSQASAAEAMSSPAVNNHTSGLSSNLGCFPTANGVGSRRRHLRPLVRSSDPVLTKRRKEIMTHHYREAFLNDPESQSPAPDSGDAAMNPVILTARLLYKYQASCALRCIPISDRRSVLVQKVYAYLFGYGLPPCVEAHFGDQVKLPSTRLVKRYRQYLEKGTPLQKVSAFRRKYENAKSDPSVDWRDLALEITDALCDHPLGERFKDENESGYDCPRVQKPMWLAKVRENILSNEYRHWSGWYSDIKLLFHNSRVLCNDRARPEYKDQEQLQEAFYELGKIFFKILNFPVP